MRTAYWLFLIPAAAQLLMIPWVNKLYPVVIGLPFLHFWLLLWMILTPIFTYIVYRIEKSRGTD